MQQDTCKLQSVDPGLRKKGQLRGVNSRASSEKERMRTEGNRKESRGRERVREAGGNKSLTCPPEQSDL